MMPKKRFIWTPDLLREEVKKFTTFKEWQEKSSGSYQTARRLGCVEEVSKHIRRLIRLDWTREEILAEAKKYDTRVAWKRAKTTSYDAVQRLGMLDEACAHMTVLWSRRWKDRRVILDDAGRFEHVNDRERASRGAYEASKVLGIFDQATAHMVPYGSTSGPELELIRQIKHVYPEAHKRWFGKIRKGCRGTRFEMDIYVDRLRKGIEFNGTYWHGEGFTRSWTPDPEEYHAKKKSFFKKLGISYMDVSEVDWYQDSSKCVQACLDFLGQDYEEKTRT